MTPEVLALYKRPLRVQGWDAALVASSSATARLNVKQVLGQFAAVRDLPALLVAGRPYWWGCSGGEDRAWGVYERVYFVKPFITHQHRNLLSNRSVICNVCVCVQANLIA